MRFNDTKMRRAVRDWVSWASPCQPVAAFDPWVERNLETELQVGLPILHSFWDPTAVFCEYVTIDQEKYFATIVH